MSKSIKYSNISGLEGNNYVFEFINDDAGDLRLIGIFKDNSILSEYNIIWTTGCW